jgi:hypothetical protein
MLPGALERAVDPLSAVCREEGVTYKAQQVDDVSKIHSEATDTSFAIKVIGQNDHRVAPYPRPSGDKAQYEEAVRRILRRMLREVGGRAGGNQGSRDDSKRKYQLVSKAVRRQRLDALERVVSGSGAQGNELVQFERDLERNLFRLSERVKQTEYKRPAWLTEDLFALLEDESRQFLESSALVENYARRRKIPGFDYALPGCGLWRALELELNRSFVRLLRIRRDIVDSNAPDEWKDIDKPDRCEIATGPRHNANIGRRAYEPRDTRAFHALTLGDMAHLLDWGYRNEVADNLKTVLASATVGDWIGPDTRSERDEVSVRSRLFRVQKIRNRHAHLSPMTFADFTKLKKLVVGEQESAPALLHRVLGLKQDMEKVRPQFGVGPCPPKADVSVDLPQQKILSMLDAPVHDTPSPKPASGGAAPVSREATTVAEEIKLDLDEVAPLAEEVPPETDEPAPASGEDFEVIEGEE